MKNDKKNSEKENKRGFSIRSVLDFVSTFVVTTVIIIAIALTVLHFAGIKGFTIESNSMAPIYPTNSFVLVKETMPDEINVGDIITYVFNEEGILVTHRVISVDSESETFITKGDNNNVQDPEPILWDNVVGKAVFWNTEDRHSYESVNRSEEQTVHFRCHYCHRNHIPCLGSDRKEQFKKRRN